MKVLTVWQPWASLIMIGAKPFEFRRWDYRERERSLVGRRIVIHAGARPVKPAEIMDLIDRCKAGAAHTSLIPEKALPLLERINAAHKCRGVVELAAGLGTATLERPRRVDQLFQSPDSDRVDHHMWAWPLTNIQPWTPPVPARGFQGFWNWAGNLPKQEAA